MRIFKEDKFPKKKILQHKHEEFFENFIFLVNNFMELNSVGKEKKKTKKNQPKLIIRS